VKRVLEQKPKRRLYLEERSLDAVIILKWICRCGAGGGLDSARDSCEHSKEHTGSIKFENSFCVQLLAS
jgi:hypothetical protein